MGISPVGVTAAVGSLFAISGNALSADYTGINFAPSFIGAGGAVSGYANAIVGGLFAPRDVTSGATWTTAIAGYFANGGIDDRVHSNLIGGCSKRHPQ